MMDQLTESIAARLGRAEVARSEGLAALAELTVMLSDRPLAMDALVALRVRLYVMRVQLHGLERDISQALKDVPVTPLSDEERAQMLDTLHRAGDHSLDTEEGSRA